MVFGDCEEAAVLIPAQEPSSRGGHWQGALVEPADWVPGNPSRSLCEAEEGG